MMLSFKKFFVYNAVIKNLLIVVLMFVASFESYAKELRMPKDIVTELVEAMAVNDSKRIKAVFSQEATQEYKRWWARKKQGDDFKKWLQSDIIDVHGRVLNPKLEVNDNQVIVTGTYVNNDNYKSTANFLFVVKEGKIVSWTIRY